MGAAKWLAVVLASSLSVGCFTRVVDEDDDWDEREYPGTWDGPPPQYAPPPDAPSTDPSVDAGAVSDASPATRDSGVPGLTWTDASGVLAERARAYFCSLGIPEDEMSGVSVVYDGSRTVRVTRAIDRIPVVESLAELRFDAEGQVDRVLIFWPRLPPERIAEARALRDRLADPVQLAAFRTQLPADAQGYGEVVLHHTPAEQPLQASATWDVLFTDAGRTSFSSVGAPVSR